MARDTPPPRSGVMMTRADATHLNVFSYSYNKGKPSCSLELLRPKLRTHAQPRAVERSFVEMHTHLQCF